MENTDDENHATFKAHIVGIPNQDSKGNYQDTYTRDIVDKRTGGFIFNGGYSYQWYQFLGVLTSIHVEGKEYEIPPDFKINICIPSHPTIEHGLTYQEYVKKLNNILLGIKIHSDIKFKGVPRRVDKSGKLEPVEPTDIENAHEIYVYSRYIDTIHIERPTRDIREKQNQYAQSRRNERLRRSKWGLKFKLKRFWQDIVKYVSENKIQLLVGFLLTLAAVVIGRVILYWLGVS